MAASEDQKLKSEKQDQSDPIQWSWGMRMKSGRHGQVTSVARDVAIASRNVATAWRPFASGLWIMFIR